ncbi:RNA methyltransferase [uncultured Christiangramia sp.]|uniref:TrmH family RNA methyltransferase n=1 Tax=uncultured Christiangramia sp. TaxID=503836 RepID=UPI0025F271D9|nr:RNA methyltransferase [uncultured Christiangramia sp.]|tara:strand:- start:630 stop:1283 length:654 start_codon:yes stop_codon:yes gene_type:complete
MTDQKLLEHLQGLLTQRRIDLFEKVLTQRTDHFTVVAQDVYQLHNTSAVVRSCDVFGIQNLHVIEENLPRRIDKEIAMGAQKWVDVHRYNTSRECLHELRQKGYQIVATTPHNNSTMLADFDIAKPSAIFFGTEQNGLSEEILREADASIKIPMYGFTESLNISVSAAIILQSLREKLDTSNIDWQFSEKRMQEVRLAWTKKTIKNSEEIIERFRNQ